MSVTLERTVSGTEDPGRLRHLVDEGLAALVNGLPDVLRPLCGEALGVTDLEGRPRSGGGKRIRPLLCLHVAQAHGAAPGEALTAALALECIHAFSLVHDDIVDGDRERRGRPSLWAAVGMRLALNAGDALQALGSSLACQSGPWAAPLLHCATLSMIEGQHLDLSSEGSAPSIDAWERLATRKTAALFAAACASGTAVAGAGDEMVERFWRLGELLGLAFQARDDILGVWGDPAVTGKPAATDLERRTTGLPVACAVEAGGAVAARVRAAMADQEVPVADLLSLLDQAGARRRAETAEAGYLAEMRRLGTAAEVPEPAWRAVHGVAASLQGRAA